MGVGGAVQGARDDAADAELGADVFRGVAHGIGDDPKAAHEYQPERQQPDEEPVGERAGDDAARDLAVAVDDLEDRVDPAAPAPLLLGPLGEALHPGLDRLLALTRALPPAALLLGFGRHEESVSRMSSCSTRSSRDRTSASCSSSGSFPSPSSASASARSLSARATKVETIAAI